MGLLTRIEEIISIPWEFFHSRKGFHPVDLTRMTIRCMDQGCRKGINRIYAPNSFVILLHPDDYNELTPFLKIMRSEILLELERSVRDNNYLLAGSLTLKIELNNSVDEGKPSVRGHMADSEEPDSVVEYDKPSDGQNNYGVIPMPGDKAESAETNLISVEPVSVFEEGVTILREGKPELALDLLSRLDSNKKDEPEYHAAVGVCKQLMGHVDEAEEHFTRLREMEPDVINIPLLGPGEQEQERKNNTSQQNVQKNQVGYRLETQIAGVSLLFMNGELLLENCYQNPAARVDGKIQRETRLKPGNMVTLGTSHLHVKKTGH